MSTAQARPAVDMPLLTAIIMLCALSLLVQYSAGTQSSCPKETRG